MINDKEKGFMLGQNQSGRSMIEMLGVLAIVGVLSAGGIAGYSIAMKNYKVNKATDMIQVISTQARGFYSNNFADISCKKLGRLGYLSSEYYDASKADDAACVSAPIGSSWKIAQKQGDKSRYQIFINGVEKAACVRLAQMSWGESSIFESLTVDGTIVSGFNGNAKIKPTIPAAADACTSEEANNLVWTFK